MFIIPGVFILFILWFAAMWRIYEKGNKPGYAMFVSIYNMYCLAEISVKDGWKFLFTLIPIFGVIYDWYLYYKLAGRFNKSSAFGLGIVFLPFIFMPLIASDETAIYQ